MFAPIRYAAARIFGAKAQPIYELARRSWVVEPAATMRSPRAIFLDGQLDRIEEVQEETTREIELTRVLGGEVNHEATTAFEIEDAAIVGGSVYAGMGRLRLLPTPFLPAALRPAEEELDQGAIDCTYTGNRYFGHWVLDDGPLHLLAREHAAPVGVMRHRYTQEADYRRLWGMESHLVESARVRKLLVFQDRGQNASKRARHERLRAPVLAMTSAGRWPGVYLRRGRSGVLRVLANEDEIETRLARRGYAIIDPEQSSVGEVLAICAGTRAVVGVEGSQLVHGLLGLVHGGVAVTLQPPWRFNNLFKDVADCVGFSYGFVVGSREAGGFRVDPDEIERTLDLAGVA